MSTTASEHQRTRRSGSATRRADVALPVLPAANSGSGKLTVAKSRAGKWRALVLVTIQLLMIAHIIHWLIAGRSITPVEPSESMEAVGRGVINAGFILFALALASTMILGRWFCGWGCHIIMLQDACTWLLKKCKIKPKPFRSRLLIYVPLLLALYMFVWPAVYRFGLVPLIPALGPVPEWNGLRVELQTEHFWETFPGVLIAIPFLLICGFATVYFLGNKGFCTYGCPYGGFFAPLDQWAPARIRVTDACEHCGHCTAVCSSNVRVHEEVREYGMIVDPGCMKCFDCVTVCPNDALYYGFGKPAIMKGPPKNAPPKANYDLSLREEIAFAIVFALIFFSFRGDIVRMPLLMAAGTAGVGTFIAWKLYKVFRDPSAALHRFRLRYKGSMTRSGWGFAAIAAIVLLFASHSGAMNLIGIAAARADDRVTLDYAQVFSLDSIEPPPTMEQDARAAIARYELAQWIPDGGAAVFPSALIDVRLAWLYACLREYEAADRHLQRRMNRHGRTDALSRDRAMLMRIQGRDDEANAYYERVLREEPEFIEMLDSYVAWRIDVGRSEEARDAMNSALERNVHHASTLSELLPRAAQLEAQLGSLDAAAAHLQNWIAIDPENARAHVMLAGVKLTQGKPDEALGLMNRAIELDSENAVYLEETANLLDMMGRSLEAREFRARVGQMRAIEE